MVWTESKQIAQIKQRWPWAFLLLGAGLGALGALCLGRPGKRWPRLMAEEWAGKRR